jgi:D-alanyl-D-alanine carboxypeptidase (penicillin-binding protein 5/6)
MKVINSPLKLILLLYSSSPVAGMMKELMKNRVTGKRKQLIGLLILLLVFGCYAYWSLHRSLPQVQPSNKSIAYSIQTGPPALAWPANGQAAVGVLGTDILATSVSTKPVPTASTAKVITALVILQKKPLKPGQQGPTLTTTVNDEAIYNNYVARNGSVVPVSAGQQISEYQLLQALLLPSANNIADSLAIWTFGSLPKYSAYANMYLKQHGLTGTHVGSDASGLAPDTTSTAGDLTRLGELAMQQPVLKEIVGQNNATIPGVGNVKNVNTLLGSNGIVGVKTGNSDQAGGAFIAASRQTINGRDTTVVTAVAGAADLPSAMKTSLPLINSAVANFKPDTVMKADAIVGYYTAPWGASIPVYVGQNLVVSVWSGDKVPLEARLSPIEARHNSSKPVGQLAVDDPAIGQASVPLIIKQAVPQPSVWWRLTHPL